jgi:DNA-binding transcriptional MerR regulator/methanogenic corrinoid protein MtbC1
MKRDKPLGISAVERETGILKETLRMWERRYGFPQPGRSSLGDRTYSSADIAKLRLLKRLLDHGLRPGQIVARPYQELQEVAQSLRRTADSVLSSDDGVTQLALFKASGIHDFRIWLREEALRRDLPDFILRVVQPLCEEIGVAWEKGDIAIFEEHLLTEQIVDVLRSAIGTLAPLPGSPRILLTTLPNERHGLGLLMVEGLLSAACGINCISLGLETPIGEIMRCAETQRVDVVALSFSAHYPARKVTSSLRELRASLPSSISLWAGGAAIRRIYTKLPGIVLLPELMDAMRAAACPGSAQL